MLVQFFDFYNNLDADPVKRGMQFEHFAKLLLKSKTELPSKPRLNHFQLFS